jgi:transcriptional regulator with XRE-family HTH domain
MGYGTNLKEAIENKGWTVAECARRAGISRQSLYTIIRRDSSVRYDHAVRLASVLGIDVNTICKENPYNDGVVEPGLLNTYNGTLDKFNKNSYIKNRMKIELELFEYKDTPIIHELLTKFFILDDEGRRQVIDSENAIAMRHTDKTRKEAFEKRNREK